MNDQFLNSSIRVFETYRKLGEKTFAQLKDEDLFHQFNSETNSIGTIVKHLHGNMLSRWTDFLNSDGEKPWREREAEFENDIRTREELLKRWNEGWDLLLNVLKDLSPGDLSRTIYIRNEAHTVLEAIMRQTAHYPYHVGQIVYVAKMIRDKEWNSLSIPRGGTKAYNESKFGK